MDKNKVKIELYKSKVMAKFSHYVSGNLYYTVQMEDGKYQFPIETVDGSEEYDSEGSVRLSADLGTTPFNAEMKGSELNRWIGKAISKEEFIKLN